MESSNNTPALFDVVKQFDRIKVDDYQRTYAWTRDEIGEFFDDLKDCVDSGEFHFFGTLIFQSATSETATIVDGQQRLTTTFVLMAALRDEINKLGPEMETLPRSATRKLPIPVINKAWEFLYHDLDPTMPRFESNRFLSDLLNKSVYAEGENQAPIKDRDSALTLAFRKAVKEIRKLVREDIEKFHSPEEKLVRINEFIDAIRDRFLVLRVMTSSLSESLEIFLTLNNRGLPLGPSDLVRGQIIASLSHAESEQAQANLHKRIFEEWSDIAENVSEVEVFLRHFLVSTGKSKVQKKKVFDTVVERLKDQSPDGKKLKAKALWKEIQEASEVYNQIIQPKMGGASQYYLEMLHGLMKSHRIFMLTLLKPSHDLPKETREAIIRQVYVLCFRWVMTGGNAQKLEDHFQNWGNTFAKNENAREVLELIKAETVGLDQDMAARYLREDGDEGYIGKAVLHAINRAVAHGANVAALDSTIHLEHIAPQTETEAWKTALFENNEKLFKEYDSFSSEIGNLTLLDFKLNMSIKQSDFGVKKVKYHNSTIRITQDLENIENWTWKLVQARTDYIVESFNQIFSIDSIDSQLPPFHEWLRR